MSKLPSLLCLIVLLLLAGCRVEAPPSPSATSTPVAAPKPAAQPPLRAEQTPEQFVASALAVKPEAVTALTAQSAGIMPNERTWTAQVNGKEVRITNLMEGVWSLSLISDQSVREKGTATLEQAQQVAETVARRRWSEALDRMKLRDNKKLGMGHFFFSWDDEVAPDISSGNRIGAMVNAAGKLLSYGEHRALKQIAPEQVKITKEEAVAIAEKHLARQQATEVIKGAHLTLSSEHTPDRGPVWYVDSQMMIKGPDGKPFPSFGNMTMVDGMSGEILELPRPDRGQAPSQAPVRTAP